MNPKTKKQPTRPQPRKQSPARQTSARVSTAASELLGMRSHGCFFYVEWTRPVVAPGQVGPISVPLRVLDVSSLVESVAGSALVQDEAKGQSPAKARKKSKGRK
jgi:hypothetical protein